MRCKLWGDTPMILRDRAAFVVLDGILIFGISCHVDIWTGLYGMFHSGKGSHLDFL